MRKLSVFLFSLFFCIPAFAQSTFDYENSPVEFTNASGTVVEFPYKVVVPNASMSATGGVVYLFTSPSGMATGPFLLLDQTTPQSVVNGTPLFKKGLSTDFEVYSGTTALQSAGSTAGLVFTRRDLAAPGSWDPGDRFVWYSSDGNYASLFTDTSGDILKIGKTGTAQIGGSTNYVTFDTVTNPIPSLITGTFPRISPTGTTGNVLWTGAMAGYVADDYLFESETAKWAGFGNADFVFPTYDIGSALEVSYFGRLIFMQRAGTIDNYSVGQAEYNSAIQGDLSSEATYSGNYHYTVGNRGIRFDVKSSEDINAADKILTVTNYGMSFEVTQSSGVETAGTLNASTVGLDIRINTSGALNSGTNNGGGIRLSGNVRTNAGDTNYGIYDDIANANWRLAQLDKYIEFYDLSTKIGADDSGHLDLFATNIDSNVGTGQSMSISSVAIGALGSVPSITFTSSGFMPGAYWGGIKNGLVVMEDQQLPSIGLLNSDASSNVWLDLDDTNGYIKLRNGGVGTGGFEIGDGTNSNPVFILHGKLSGSTGERYVQAQIDTAGVFNISREDTNITKCNFAMPLSVQSGLSMSFDGTNSNFSSSAGNMIFTASTNSSIQFYGNLIMTATGSQGVIEAYNTALTQKIQLFNDGTYSKILSSTGKLTLGGVTGVNNEDMIYDFETYSNVCLVTTSTGAELDYQDVPVKFNVTTSHTHGKAGAYMIDAHTNTNFPENAGNEVDGMYLGDDSSVATDYLFLLHINASVNATRCTNIGVGIHGDAQRGVLVEQSASTASAGTPYAFLSLDKNNSGVAPHFTAMNTATPVFQVTHSGSVTSFTGMASASSSSYLNSVYNFYKAFTGTGVSSSMYVKTEQTSGGGAAAVPVGATFTADVTGGTFSHAVGILGWAQPTASSVAGSYTGIEGRVDLGKISSSGYAVNGICNLTSSNNAASTGYAGNFQAENATDPGNGAMIGIQAYAKGGALNYNAIFGDGSVSGDNGLVRFRGFISSSGGAQANADVAVNDVIDKFFFDLRDARLLGMSIALSDAVGATSFNIYNSSIATVFNVDSYGCTTTHGRKTGITVKTGTYTATVADETIVCNSTTAFTINLPSATGSGQKYTIKNINTGTITIDGNSTDTIDGVETQTLPQWSSYDVTDYAANKWIIS